MCQCRRVAVVAAILAVSSLGASDFLLFVARASDKPAKAREAQLDALIDALANGVNTAPELVYRGTRYGDHGFPLFGEEYDYKEQARVYQALRKLNKRSGNELWPRLVAHFDDKRYAFTYSDGTGMPVNKTVGNLCWGVAINDLTLAFQKHSPPNPKVHSPFSRWMVHAPKWDRKTFQEWLDSRKGKEMYELQIDLCEWASTTPAAVKWLSDDERQDFVQKLKDQIETLKLTHATVVDKKRFDDSWYRLYSAEQLQAIRDEDEQRRSSRRDPAPPTTAPQEGETKPQGPSKGAPKKQQ